ncbi:hypothetical protein Tco_1411042 [Tanacetum coccineum]
MQIANTESSRIAVSWWSCVRIGWPGAVETDARACVIDGQGDLSEGEALGRGEEEEREEGKTGAGEAEGGGGSLCGRERHASMVGGAVMSDEYVWRKGCRKEGWRGDGRERCRGEGKEDKKAAEWVAEGGMRKDRADDRGVGCDEAERGGLIGKEGVGATLREGKRREMQRGEGRMGRGGSGESEEWEGGRERYRGRAGRCGEREAEEIGLWRFGDDRSRVRRVDVRGGECRGGRTSKRCTGVERGDRGGEWALRAGSTLGGVRWGGRCWGGAGRQVGPRVGSDRRRAGVSTQAGETLRVGGAGGNAERGQRGRQGNEWGA